jgi:hypothetical protein
MFKINLNAHSDFIPAVGASPDAIIHEQVLKITIALCAGVVGGDRHCLLLYLREISNNWLIKNEFSNAKNGIVSIFHIRLTRHLSTWLPSQNGLLHDFPHLHSVTRLRISYT